MPHKKSPKSRLVSFRQIDLTGGAPIGLSPRPWLAVVIDPQTGLVVEGWMADDPTLLVPDRQLWRQIKIPRGSGDSPQPSNPRQAPAKLTRGPAVRTAKTRSKSNGAGAGH